VEDLSVSEIIAVFEELRLNESDEQEGYWTTKEIVRASGISQDQVHSALQELNDMDRLEVIRVKRRAIDGVMRTVPAYRAKEAED